MNISWYRPDPCAASDPCPLWGSPPRRRQTDHPWEAEPSGWCSPWSPSGPWGQFLRRHANMPPSAPRSSCPGSPKLWRTDFHRCIQRTWGLPGIPGQNASSYPCSSCSSRAVPPQWVWTYQQYDGFANNIIPYFT